MCPAPLVKATGMFRFVDQGSFLEDLVVLLEDDRATYLSLGPHQAILSSKTRGYFGIGESRGAEWSRIEPRKRAELVLAWIHEAAAYWRNARKKYCDTGRVKAAV